MATTRKPHTAATKLRKKPPATATRPVPRQADVAARERAAVDGERRVHFARVLDAARGLNTAVTNVRERKRHLLGLLELSVNTDFARLYADMFPGLEARFDPEFATTAQRITALLDTDALIDLERAARALTRVPALRRRAARTKREDDIVIAALIDRGMPIKAAVRVAVTPGKSESERDRLETAKFEAALQRTKRLRRAAEQDEQDTAAWAAKRANASLLGRALMAPSRREDEILRAIAGTDLLPR